MDRKKQLKQQFKETKVEGGVYQIKNHVNGKVFVNSTKNFKTFNGERFMLEMNNHMNKELQREWNEFGTDSFVFDILEVLKPRENEYFDQKRELDKLEEKWLNELQPYGERGYHRKKDE